jgi:glyoxylase I family protein
MIAGIEHVALVTHNPEALAQWYVETLGFHINYHSASSRTHFVKAPNGSMLEIILAKSDERGPNEMRTPGIRHLAISVSGFDEELARLRSLGVRFLTEPESSKGNQVVFFADPDGNIVHFIERAEPLP